MRVVDPVSYAWQMPHACLNHCLLFSLSMVSIALMALQTERPDDEDDDGRLPYTVYVLELEAGFFYVGITEQDIDLCWAEHVEGTGSEWTRQVLS